MKSSFPSLRHCPNRLPESQQRDGEKRAANCHQRQELRPDDFESGTPVENGLREANKVCRRHGQHNVLHHLRHTFARRGSTGKHLQRQQHQNHQQPQLRH